jgi:hypothetical protein
MEPVKIASKGGECKVHKSKSDASSVHVKGKSGINEADIDMMVSGHPTSERLL